MKRKNVEAPSRIKARKHLNADSLFHCLYCGFTKIPDHRPGDVDIPLADILMSGFAMFSLEDLSLLFEKLRKEHPHLPLIVNEDALSPNAPHIRDLEKYNLRYILGVKPGDHAFLFNYVNEASLEGLTTEFEFVDEKNPKITHRFRFLNGVP